MKTISPSRRTYRVMVGPVTPDRVPDHYVEFQSTTVAAAKRQAAEFLCGPMGPAWVSRLDTLQIKSGGLWLSVKDGEDLAATKGARGLLYPPGMWGKGEV